jgi:hypothetical protein
MLFRALLAIVCIASVSACDARGKGVVTGVLTPSPFDDLVATITPSAFVNIPAVGLPCIVPGGASIGFDLAISASRTVDLNRVTLRLTDGTSVGGSSITFPTPLLTERFQTTVIPAGSTRVLTFNPPFGCAVLPSSFVFADIFLTDVSGSSRLVTISTGIPTTH